MIDSARDFDLLGELVPQVRVSARTLALLGLFDFNMCVCVCKYIFIFHLIDTVYLRDPNLKVIYL